MKIDGPTFVKINDQLYSYNQFRGLTVFELYNHLIGKYVNERVNQFIIDQIVNDMNGWLMVNNVIGLVPVVDIDLLGYDNTFYIDFKVQ